MTTADGDEPPLSVREEDVRIPTTDGVCDAAFISPVDGAHPAVLVWTDAFGLRPALRGIGRRLAANGYAVLIPNPFYRVGEATALGLSPQTVSFQDEADRARLRELMSGIQAPGAAESDSAACLAFLDSREQVDPRYSIGVQGYCMGGALALRTAAALPDRIGAVASFHGGGLVTDAPNSPHRLLPQMRARGYVGVAADDDERQPDAKQALREAFASAGLTAEVEVYPALHGWCMPDMPERAGKPVFSEPNAERAWGKLTELYRSTLG